MASKRYAGRVARKVSRKAFRGALKMPKLKLAKIYATKCGQTAYRAAKTLGGKAKLWGKRRRRRGRRYKRSRW